MTSTDIEPVLREGGLYFQKILDIESVPCTQSGDNYASEISRTTIKVLQDSGKTETLHVVVKKSHESKAEAELFGELGMFRVEIKMYTEVLPEVEKVYRKYLKDVEIPWAHCLGTRKYDRVILEDLKLTGYRTVDRYKRLDMEHATLLLDNLARYHASTVVLLESGELDVSDLNKYFLAEPKYELSGDMFKHNIMALSNVMKESWGPEWTEASERILKTAHEFLEKSSQLCEVKASNFNVLNHGDLWVNNFMFNYCSKTGKPQNVKFIDFQLSHYNTPSVDLQYFFHSAFHPTILSANYHHLLHIYHSALLRAFKSLNYFPRHLFTLQDLKKDMQDKMYMGLVVTVVLTPFIMSDRGDGLDIDKIMGGEQEDAAERFYRVPAVEEAIKLALPRFVKLGIL